MQRAMLADNRLAVDAYYIVIRECLCYLLKRQVVVLRLVIGWYKHSAVYD